MVTLNSGFSEEASTKQKITPDERSMIDAFIAKNGVQVVQPAAAQGNEQTKITNAIIAQKRREFRKKNQGKTFQRKG